MEEKVQKQLEKLLKESKSVDSNSVKVEADFKEALREKIYSHYINEKSKGSGIMESIKQVFSNKKQLLLAGLAGFFAIALIGGGVFIAQRRTDEADTSQEQILLAANLAFSDGEVSIKLEGEDRWVEAKQDDVLHQGDMIKTGEESRAVLEIDNGDAIRLDSSTEVKLASLVPSDVVVENIEGQVYSRVMESDSNTYTVRAENLQVKALGTAYTVSNDQEKGKVTVGVVQSNVELSKDSTEVKEGKKALYDVENDKLELKDIEKKELETDFMKWNKEKDQEKGFDVGVMTDLVAPTLKITEPADGSSTTAESVSVKGTTEKGAIVKVNGNEVENKDGVFSTTVSLEMGENTITVTSTDSYDNTTTKTVKVTREEEQTEPPVPTTHINVTNVYAEGSSIKVSWTYDGYRVIDGYKIVVGDGYYPKYPDSYDKFAYVSGQDKTSGLISDLGAGTYNVAVCGYSASTHRCYDDLYSLYYSITIEEGQTGVVNSISLSATPIGGGKVKLQWSVDGYSAKGFKVVRSESPNPEYPPRSEDSVIKYISDPSTASFTVTGLTVGKIYHFRVCEYLGGACGTYSNDASATVSS